MLRRIVKQLSVLKSLDNTTSLVSLYVPTSTKVTDLSKMIASEISKVSNVKSRLTRQGTERALQSISTHLKSMNKLPNNGLIMFTGQTTDKYINQIIEPSKPVNRFLYRCESSFCL
jgi:peptide chain release factor subunit 1